MRNRKTTLERLKIRILIFPSSSRQYSVKTPNNSVRAAPLHYIIARPNAFGKIESVYKSTIISIVNPEGWSLAQRLHLP